LIMLDHILIKKDLNKIMTMKQSLLTKIAKKNQLQNHLELRKIEKKNQQKKSPNISLTNIELVYLPPNTTAHLQPMDAGIIHSFKAKYKQEFCKHLIYQFDSGIDYTK